MNMQRCVEEKADNKACAYADSVYSVTLAYKQDLHEQTTSIVFSSNCPNCGAPIDASAKGREVSVLRSGITEMPTVYGWSTILI